MIEGDILKSVKLFYENILQSTVRYLYSDNTEYVYKFTCKSLLSYVFNNNIDMLLLRCIPYKFILN